ncbi:hypothetical protein H1P_5120001 [Hyella patelloides LEGE 07179]|uniref:Uncharacterized protein n=1 Tax=Hyella patelloides LEGE 07179 TaxID=945734 RepID=A0A563W095_9CYAN|nr:hypothetical protein [Hyella patelloides]VEP16943.1 hypothetical protein H1P_5120001 [Hyella patelloides LEGE 07179]
MSYTDLYYARKVAKEFGFAHRLWMPKLPILADSSSETILLGSLVREIDKIFEPSYPLTTPLTKPQILLNRLKEEKNRLKLLSNDKLVLSKKVAGATILMKANKNLAVGAEAGFPGIPYSKSVNFGITKNELVSVSLALNEEAEIQSIPTDYIARFGKLFGGESKEAFPDVVVDIDDELFIDLVVLAKNFSATYSFNQAISSRIEDEISAANASLSSKLVFNKANEYSIEVKIKDNKTYVIGFKTIDWDEVDF